MKKTPNKRTPFFFVRVPWKTEEKTLRGGCAVLSVRGERNHSTHVDFILLFNFVSFSFFQRKMIFLKNLESIIRTEVVVVEEAEEEATGGALVFI